MNPSERLAERYLRFRGFQSVVYEPDGKVPPDLLADSTVAVEVRRLNQLSGAGIDAKGLEETAIPVQNRMHKLLSSLGPPIDGRSWFVSYSFRRPVPQWKTLSRAVNHALVGFRDGTEHRATRIQISERFQLEITPASRLHASLFLLGGPGDDDAGGWLLCELNASLSFCIEEKTRKCANYRHRYPEWWLVFEDRIGYSLDEADRAEFRGTFQIAHGWDKVVLLDPRNHERAFEL